MAEVHETDVLIIGAGPVGLTLANLLTMHGVSFRIIDQRTDLSRHPRARFIDVRSMEVFRVLGVSQELYSHCLPEAWTRNLVYTKSIVGDEVGRYRASTFHTQSTDASPEMPVMSSQDALEPILYKRLNRYARGSCSLGCRLLTLENCGDGVVAQAAQSGARVSYKARLVVGADGSRSTVREHAGIETQGFRGKHLTYDVLFQADLTAYVAGREASLIWFQLDHGVGAFQPIDGGNRWRVQLNFGRELADEDVETRCVDAIRAAIGSQTVDFEVQSISPWVMNATVADRFRQGAFFLVGDAAATTSPTGGLGMNAGIHSAHNLAWRLAYFLAGIAGEEVLDGYEAERRPFALRNANLSLRNIEGVRQLYKAATDVDRAVALRRLEAYGNFDDEVMEGYGGARYKRDLSDLSVGQIFPHQWLGEGRSTKDLFSTEHVLLAAKPPAASRLDHVNFVELTGLPCAFIVRPDGVIESIVSELEAR